MPLKKYKPITNQLPPERAGELEMLMLKSPPTSLKRVC